MVKTGIACPGKTCVFLVDDLNPVISSGIFLTDGRAAVRSAVIDQQDLQIAVALSQNAIQAGRQIGFHVIDRNNDTDKGLHPYLLSASGC